MKDFLGMAWAGPIGRTFAQGALGVLTEAGLGWADSAVFEGAMIAGVAAVFAYLQGKLRAEA